MEEIMSCVRSLNEGKRKPACVKPGQKGFNMNHDKFGRFSTKTKAKSWSNAADYYGADRKDCVGGKFKTKGTNHKYWTRNKCGVNADGEKNKYVCSTGKEVQENEDIRPGQKKRRIIVRIRSKKNEDRRDKSKIRKRDEILPGSHELSKLSRGLIEGRDISMSLDEFITNVGVVYEGLVGQDIKRFEKGLAELGFVAVESIEEMCSSNGMNTMKTWLKIMNSIELSKKGELFKKEKSK